MQKSKQILYIPVPEKHFNQRRHIRLNKQNDGKIFQNDISHL